MTELPIEIKAAIGNSLIEQYACDETQLAFIFDKWEDDALKMYAQGADPPDIARDLFSQWLEWEPGKAKKR